MFAEFTEYILASWYTGNRTKSRWHKANVSRSKLLEISSNTDIFNIKSSFLGCVAGSLVQICYPQTLYIYHTYIMRRLHTFERRIALYMFLHAVTLVHFSFAWIILGVLKEPHICWLDAVVIRQCCIARCEPDCIVTMYSCMDQLQNGVFHFCAKQNSVQQLVDTVSKPNRWITNYIICRQNSKGPSVVQNVSFYILFLLFLFCLYDCSKLCTFVWRGTNDGVFFCWDKKSINHEKVSVVFLQMTIT